MIDVQEAIERLVAGEVIGYPTETFYGLAVDPSNKSAVRKLLELKNRSLTEGIPLIAKDSSLVDSLVLDLNDLVRERRLSLQSSFWPGPLTIVFETNSYARDIISDGVFGPQKTLAVRVSSLELALELARNSPIGFITSTSANPRGESPPSSVEEVKAPEKEVVTAQLSGIDIMDLDDAVQVLWKEGIYAESGMGCTGPIVLVSEANQNKAAEILVAAGYMAGEKTGC